MSRRQNPSEFLKQIIGKPVVVKLNSGVDYRGILACLDGFMNIALEQTEEYNNGQLQNKYGDAFIRGKKRKEEYALEECRPDREVRVSFFEASQPAVKGR
ncbi:LSM domain protein [Necator americanus]|uniref:LSM domain protein n=1 Tax=Necator americanus TaxID=51031 RepID=W2TLH7_NECAM|nr:LSM domain protein [Necator americanus]ETN81872.1 LSM domain protein [Necator americanus]